MQQSKRRKGLLFTFATGLVAVAMASTAFACVTFKGQMTVDGHDGDTTVVGTGSTHAYCTQPTTAAAGHLSDTINVSVQPATCNGKGHKMEKGDYLVKFNNEDSYNFDGTVWTMESNTGCFLSDNANTTSDADPDRFFVDDAGYGTWSGTLGTLNGTAFTVEPGSWDASNFCVGAANSTVTGRTGLLAPFQLLAI